MKIGILFFGGGPPVFFEWDGFCEFLLFISLLVQRNGTKERIPNTRNFSVYDGKPIPKLRAEQVLLSTGAFVHLFCVLGFMES